MANSATVASLKAARDNVAAVILAKTQEWLAVGCPPTFSIDGESYQWEGWLKARTAEVDALTASISALSSPWIVRSTGRA